jgi:hypothetical protein
MEKKTDISKDEDNGFIDEDYNEVKHDYLNNATGKAGHDQSKAIPDSNVYSEYIE